MKYRYVSSSRFLYSVHIVFPLNSSGLCVLQGSVDPDVSPHRSFVWIMQSTFHASFLSPLFPPSLPLSTLSRSMVNHQVPWRPVIWNKRDASLHSLNTAVTCWECLFLFLPHSSECCKVTEEEEDTCW